MQNTSQENIYAEFWAEIVNIKESSKKEDVTECEFGCMM